MKKFLLSIVALIASVCMLSSCKDDGPSEPKQTEWPESDHTYLIYMIGDNSLFSWCKQNTEKAIKGLLKSETPVNLVIYDDSWRSNFEGIEEGTPVLFRLKRNFVDRQKVDTIMIHQFEKDHNSADPEIMQSIINEAFAACPASVKGLEIWCHGLGWAPSYKYQATKASEATRASQWVGPDDDRYLEIWELRKALEKCPHMNYIAFDACNMGQAEVAYELKDVADYMMACPTEIMAAGLPYTDLIRILSGVNNVSALPKCFPEITYAFQQQSSVNYYDGTFSILDLKAMTELHHAYKILLSVCSERLQNLEEMPYAYLNGLQQFGRGWISMGAHNLFFDMLSVADFLAKDQPELPAYIQLKKALSKTILYEYHTDSFLDLGKITCCGIGVALPEVFSTLGDGKKIQSAYNQLQWTKD